MQIDQKAVELVRHWQRHPNKWVWDIFGDAFRPTNQQRKAWDELGKLVSAKIKLRDGEELTHEDQKYARKFGVSIMSGNGTGKDAWSAITLLWFEHVFAEGYGLATANSAKQLRNVLWREISKWMRQAKKLDSGKTVLEEVFEWQAEKIFWKEFKGREWFIEAVTINTKASDTEQAEAIAGRHERHMILVVDEASGIASSVFNKLEATMTQPVNIMLLIFNPTRAKGYAVESQESEHWLHFRWNAEEVVSEGRTDLITEDQIKRIEEKYGRESNPFRIRVLGLPPLTESDTLIPQDWIEDAVERQYAILEDMPLIKGVDVGAGGDKSVILSRVGPRVTKISRHNTQDTMLLVSKVSQEAEFDEPKAIMVDPIGIGKGVYDRLRQTGRIVYPVDVRRASRQPDRFQRLRDELWWKVREEFENGTISIPDDMELKDELSVMRYDTETGKIKVESKKKLKLRGEHSPDEADALCLTYFLPESVFTPVKKDRYSKDPERKQYSWMGRTILWMLFGIKLSLFLNAVV